MAKNLFTSFNNNMKVNFPIVNSVSKVPRIPIKKYLTKMQSFQDDALFGSIEYVKNQPTLISKIEGSFTKEDLEILVPRYSKEYLESKCDLKKERELLGKQILQETNQLIVEDFSKDYDIVLERKILNNDVKNSVRGIGLRLFTIKNLLNKDIKKTLSSPMKSWYETDLGIQNPLINKTIFNHPIDKAISIIGLLTKEDYDEIARLEAKYVRFDDIEIQKKKLKILNKLSKQFKNPQSEFIGTFTAKNHEQLRGLVINYQALNRVHKQRGIYTKKLEKVRYASKIQDNLKVGDYINGLGLVVNRINISTNENRKIPAVICFSNDKGFNAFKMYDLEKLREVSNRNDISALDEERNALVSEVCFAYQERFKAYYVKSFKNLNSKKYPTGGKIIGLQLLKLLYEKDCKPIRLIAANKEGVHSPVNYYRRFGFTPISYTNEEIEKMIGDNGGRFPKEIGVVFGLTDFDKLGERIKKYEKILFSNC